MKVPFLNLKNINERYSKELLDACSRVIESGHYVNGLEVDSFEREFAEFCGARHCVGVANGLDALKIVLLSWREMGLLPSGSEIILPANTFIASALAVSECGFKPVLVEPDPDSFNLTTNTIKKALTNKTRVIMPVHLYGRLADMPSICSFAKEEGLLILEDAAQAHGASVNSQIAGNWGDAGGFSFYPGKNLGALGDAGALTTNSDLTLEMSKMIRNYGSNKKYIHQVKGINSRLDEIQAAILRVKLKYFSEDINLRRAIAEKYLAGIRNPLIKKPSAGLTFQHVWHLFVIRCRYRDSLQSHLKKNGIETLIHYPNPIHRQHAYAELSDISAPVTEELQEQVLSIPIDPTLTHAQTNWVIETCNSFSMNNFA